MTRAVSLRLALLAVAFLMAAPRLSAQCSFPGATHVTWPSSNPVWDFCFRRPNDSPGANGSGLELSDVKYNGTLVIFQAHIPILNVKYVPDNEDGCGGFNWCYRDWLDTEVAFECAPTVAPGICTGTTTPASTVCEHPGSDAGTFSGVAVESLPDRLKLTAQCWAGWYRYVPVWEFFPDGTIQARFAATSVDDTCVKHTHHHHAYFRLDLDVNGKTGNYVDRVLPDSSTERVTSERNFIDTSPSRSKWRVASPGSPYVVEISRNPADGAAGDPPPIPGDFPVADGWVLAYAANQISDYPDLNICPANINAWDDNQNVDGADVVMWVRASGLHEGEPGGESDDCGIFGPTIRVLPAAAPSATDFHTLTPCRIVDTRNDPGQYGAPALQAGATRDFVLAGQCSVPTTAKSVAVNMTVTQPTVGGHLTAFPAGQGVPLASSLNFGSGQTRANNAVLRLGAGGAISVNCVLSSPGSVHFILDAVGWFE